MTHLCRQSVRSVVLRARPKLADIKRRAKRNKDFSITTSQSLAEMRGARSGAKVPAFRPFDAELAARPADAGRFDEASDGEA